MIGYFNRDIRKLIEKWIFRNKILLILGARQVGKTTFVKELQKKYGKPGQYLNCELITVKDILESKDPYSIRKFIGDTNLVIFDEAQKINEIGLSLKLLHDTFPELQIIATGSSSFDLKNKTDEPLTGRALDFMLYPFSLNELRQNLHVTELHSSLNNYLRFGMYPDIVNKKDDESRVLLENLTSRYLYKDILEFESLRKPDMIVKLLQLLALQVGSVVSMNELSVKLGMTRKTIERYIELLEKAFVIFRLNAYSNNPRKEITKKVKIYFYDTGIRNSIISQYNILTHRNDTGALWENFCITEIMKKFSNIGIRKNYFFWRNKTGSEIDLITDYNGELDAYEFKWKDDKAKIPKDFSMLYKSAKYTLINSKNIFDLI